MNEGEQDDRSIILPYSLCVCEIVNGNGEERAGKNRGREKGPNREKERERGRRCGCLSFC